MNDLTIDHLLNLIQSTKTLTEEEQKAWRIRLFEDWENHGGLLSEAFQNELATLFEKENHHLQDVLSPEVEKDYEKAAENEQSIREKVTPELNELVEEYTIVTSQILKEVEEAEKTLGKEFDEALQEALAPQEEAEMAAIRQKLSQKKPY